MVQDHLRRELHRVGQGGGTNNDDEAMGKNERSTRTSPYKCSCAPSQFQPGFRSCPNTIRVHVLAQAVGQDDKFVLVQHPLIPHQLLQSFSPGTCARSSASTQSSPAARAPSSPHGDRGHDHVSGPFYDLPHKRKFIHAHTFGVLVPGPGAVHPEQGRLVVFDLSCHILGPQARSIERSRSCA